MKTGWPLVLLLTSCRLDETSNEVDDETSNVDNETSGTDIGMSGVDGAGTGQAPVPTEPDAPPRVEPQSAPEAPVHCEGWLGLGGAEDCIYVWSNCSDGDDREVRCSRNGEGFSCACIKGGASISGFESDEFCLLTAGPTSLERALLSEAVSPGCGWELSP